MRAWAAEIQNYNSAELMLTCVQALRSLTREETGRGAQSTVEGASRVLEGLGLHEVHHEQAFY